MQVSLLKAGLVSPFQLMLSSCSFILFYLPYTFCCQLSFVSHHQWLTGVQLSSSFHKRPVPRLSFQQLSYLFPIRLIYFFLSSLNVSSFSILLSLRLSSTHFLTSLKPASTLFLTPLGPASTLFLRPAFSIRLSTLFLTFL